MGEACQKSAPWKCLGRDPTGRCQVSELLGAREAYGFWALLELRYGEAALCRTVLHFHGEAQDRVAPGCAFGMKAGWPVCPVRFQLSLVLQKSHPCSLFIAPLGASSISPSNTISQLG